MDNYKKIHEAAIVFRNMLEQCSGKNKAVVYWAVLDTDEVANGLTLSDDITSQELEHTSFCLVGKAYNMVDYNEQPNERVE